jgi:nicotinate-nucleotide adenylyltransferase
MSRIGIFGGTFDPPHIGHLILAQCAYQQLGLKKIIFIPAGRQPHKLDKPISPSKLRLDMLSLGIKGDNRFEVSSIEIDQNRVSYTFQTLKELKLRHPDDDLYFIMGGDNIKDIETWKNPETIFELAKVAAAHRPDCAIEGKYKDKIMLFEMPQIDISSTSIRNSVRDGRAIKYLVPETVEGFIIKNQLYK